MQIEQINLQTHFGGGEVYTAFLTRALDRLGIRSTLYVHPKAQFWTQLGLPKSTQIQTMTQHDALPQRLEQTRVQQTNAQPRWLLSHGPLAQSVLQSLARTPGAYLCTAIAHMPVQGRNPQVFAGHDMVFPVSEWVRTGLLAAGIKTWHEPLYGVADLTQRASAQPEPLLYQSPYDWDQRKVRDRLLGLLETLSSPLRQAWRAPQVLTKKPGLTLGIVSRLTPIKQLPQLFTQLLPILLRYPEFNLEIVGSGGYASVRDLQRVLKPLGSRVRFWGQQRDIKAVYAQLDYLLSGLPEKEALGLNIIEAQSCNLPVLAVNAPPFSETVAQEQTGYLYRDPRQDQGADFAQLLTRLIAAPSRLQPASAHAHLARFSADALCERLRAVQRWVVAQ
ncbi:MAG: glycosyltransferase family 4 protein [Pseudomonadota bacterium]